MYCQSILHTFLHKMSQKWTCVHPLPPSSSSSKIDGIMQISRKFGWPFAQIQEIDGVKRKEGSALFFWEKGTLVCSLEFELVSKVWETRNEIRSPWVFTFWISANCSSDLCHNGGTCVPSEHNDNEQVCECPTGFTGAKCQYGKE